MLLDNFLMAIGNTSRSKAYLQMMLRKNYIPSKCLLLMEEEVLPLDGLPVEANEENCKYFNEAESILETLKRNNIAYQIAGTKDINSEIVKETLKNLPQEYVIYSGYGGFILKKHLFQMGKKFIHIHAGILPQYRGSTTAYYSMLKEKSIGATAIFMSEEIDAGDVITEGVYPLPEDDVNIDYIYEPYVRANVLIKALAQYKENGCFTIKRQNEAVSETYYIIHPVLKHIALLGAEHARKGFS